MGDDGLSLSPSLSLFVSPTHRESGVWMCIILSLHASPSSSHISHTDLHKMPHTPHLPWVLEYNECCCLQNPVCCICLCHVDQTLKSAAEDSVCCTLHFTPFLRDILNSIHTKSLTVLLNVRPRYMFIGLFY